MMLNWSEYRDQVNAAIKGKSVVRIHAGEPFS